MRPRSDTGLAPCRCSTASSAIASGEPEAMRSLVFLGFERSRILLAVAAVIALLAVEHLQGAKPVSLRGRIRAMHAPLRWAAYACAVLTIMTLGVFQSAKFIYFQF